MNFRALRSWLLCFAVVPALLLAMDLVGRIPTAPAYLSSGPPTEIGYVDQAGDPQGAEIIPASGTLYLRGWAADTWQGAPVEQVVVYVDGIGVGSAKLGVERHDVERYYGREGYVRSGWTFAMPASRLGPGTHTVSVKAIGPSRAVEIAPLRTVTIGGGKKS